MTTTIYILKLNDNKYYIGKTNRTVNERYQEHVEGIGSFWTNKYKPISINKEIINCSPFDEDRYVKEYMSIYGVENVRGGSYNQEVLNDDVVKFLKNELRTSNNECYKCGSNKHFVSECVYICIDNYIEIFRNCILMSLDAEISYLKDKFINIKSIYDVYESKKKLLYDVLKCDYNEIDKYAENIREYYKKYCNRGNQFRDCNVLSIQYYECLFEYKEFYDRFNIISVRDRQDRLLIIKENIVKLDNMECEKLNKTIDTINLDILIRQMNAIMKLKRDLIIIPNMK